MAENSKGDDYMSKIVKLLVKNFLGVEELGLAPGKVNILKGPMGSGKTSVIEAIEKSFTNNNRRTEVVRHGSEEATLFIELDSGLEIDRRIRRSRADYLKVRKENEYVPSTERFLRSLVSGEIFRPVEWVGKDIKEQTKSILNMLQIGWTRDNIEGWFGELTCNIDYSRHILQVLKDIEIKYYNDREEINREIRELKTQLTLIAKELPAGYDGEAWRSLKVQDYYNKVREAQQINNWISEARALQENLEARIAALKANGESEKNRLRLKFREQRSDIKDIIELSKAKIERTARSLEGLEVAFKNSLKDIEVQSESEKTELEQELEERIRSLRAEYSEKKAAVDKKAEEERDRLKRELKESREQCQDLIVVNENKISVKEQELLSLDKIETASLEAVEIKVASEIEKEQLKAGKAAEYIRNNDVLDLEPLQKAADEVAEMQSYLRQWDMLLDIRDSKLPSKEKYSAWLSANIDKARTLPAELLKTARMPIEGISVDEQGLIRINGTLIDGLSDGEKLELAMKIAKAQAGELKVICIDKWESLNERARQRFQEEMEKDEFQYFVTVAGDTESEAVEIEKIE
jgi:hypothetical protein